MEEEKLIQQEPVSQEEFEQQIKKIAENNRNKVYNDFEEGIIYLRNYYAVGLFKSVRRAIKRGHVSIFGDIYPHRPFNNRKRKKGTDTYNKRRIYECLTHKQNKVC